MASAAAVGVNDALSPIENDLGTDEGLPGAITSGVLPKDDDEELPDINGEDDEDDDLPSNPLHKRGGQRRLHGDVEDDDDDDGGLDDALFGEDDDAAQAEGSVPLRRQLNDAELDSGDDMDRTDRMAEEEEEPQQEYQAIERAVIDLEVARQPVPEPSDGEMYLLKVPTFMAIEPHAWDLKAFQPPTTDHHSLRPPTETFSAYNTALSTVRWRHSPSDHSKLQSNARINRWSDGSLTLQLASDPCTQYEIDGNALAPPQRNPLKPTPTSLQAAGQKGGRHSGTTKDAFTYLIRPHPETSTMLVTHKITAGLSVKQAGTVEDDAIERLQASLAAATNASKVNGASGINLIQIDTDPEAAKKEAMEAIKQQEKDRKKLQAARDREAARSDRVLGRKGLGGNRYSGLNVGMLEDDEDGGAGSRPSPNKARKPRRRRNSEYSEDEDFGRKRFAAEDEYEVDDFVAASDEEEVVEDDDDDSDDGIVEESDRRERTPKRDRPAEDDEADAPGEEEDEADVQTARTKRRRIVDDEDEE